MKNNSWKCFTEEKPDEKKWILVKNCLYRGRM